MPNLLSLLTEKIDMSGYRPIPNPHPPVDGLVPASQRNVFLRCPVPPIGTVSPDNLQQFDMAGQIPQYRTFVK